MSVFPYKLQVRYECGKWATMLTHDNMHDAERSFEFFKSVQVCRILLGRKVLAGER